MDRFLVWPRGWCGALLVGARRGGAGHSYSKRVSPARHLWTLFEPLHAVTYFTAEGMEAFQAAGFRGFWRGYFAGRSAPLGRAPASVTTALYGNFAPQMVERAIPSIWDLASPEVALAARRRGSVAALTRLFGDLPGVDEAASLLRRVAEAAPTSGRALGAANAALPWPDEPVDVLWQAATTLRELRGDGHLAGQLAVGLGGIDTIVLRCGHDMPRDLMQLARGWTDEEWDASLARLQDRGLLGADGRITDAGLDALALAEEVTDRLAQEPWDAVGPAAASRFVELATPLAAAARTELPDVTPLGLPDESAASAPAS